jgi:hypothetical protein
MPRDVTKNPEVNEANGVLDEVQAWYLASVRAGSTPVCCVNSSIACTAIATTSTGANARDGVGL